MEEHGSFGQGFFYLLQDFCITINCSSDTITTGTSCVCLEGVPDHHFSLKSLPVKNTRDHLVSLKATPVRNGRMVSLICDILKKRKIVAGHW